VVYILEPCRLQSPDVEFMKILCTNAVVIPVIGKADSMDPTQKKLWKTELFDLLTENKIEFLDLSVDKTVLAVMGSEKGNTRNYSGVGTVDVFDPTVSDTELFRKQLYNKYHTIVDLRRAFSRTWRETPKWRRIKDSTQKEFNKQRMFLALIAVLVLVFALGIAFGTHVTIPQINPRGK